MTNYTIAKSRRLRGTPYTSRIEKQGATAYTVYNHMLLPAAFGSVEDSYHHLKEHVQVWDVAAERQVEISGKDSAKLVQLMTCRDLSKSKDGRCYYCPILDDTAGIINDPVVLRINENKWWISIADSDVILFAKGLAIGHKFDVNIVEPNVDIMAVQGPKSFKLMEKVFGEKITKLKFFGFDYFDFQGDKHLIAQSGWSKQGGYEIYVQNTESGQKLYDHLFEVGKEYHKSDDGKYVEIEKLALFICGFKNDNHWNTLEKKSDYFFLKGIIKSITDRLGFSNVKSKPITSDNISDGETIFYNKSEILSFGLISKDVCEYFDINEKVLYAEIDVKTVLDKYSIKPVQFKSISKFPEVTRDLSILIDDDLNFDKIYKTTKQIDQNLIKDVSLFDVFEGKNLPKNKKSYGISFKLQDNKKTLSENEIEEVMGKIISRLKKEFNAELR